MFSCTSKILIAYALITAVVAFFFVPINRTTESEQASGYSKLSVKTTKKSTEIVIFPMYSRTRGIRISTQTGAKTTTSLRLTPYAIEIGGFIFLGIMNSLIFCLLRKRRNMDNPVS